MLLFEAAGVDMDAAAPPPSGVSVSVRLRPLSVTERSAGATEVFIKDTDTKLIEQKPDGSLVAWQFMNNCFGPADTTVMLFNIICVPLLVQVEFLLIHIFSYH